MQELLVSNLKFVRLINSKNVVFLLKYHFNPVSLWLLLFYLLPIHMKCSCLEKLHY